MADNGMVATSQPLATEIAVEILKKGGTAIDAAISANAALGLMEPTGAGIGGDLFAIVWDASEGKLHGLNASGRAPKSLQLERLRELCVDAIPEYGPLSVSVPGAVDGWFVLHKRFGRLPMEEILAPTIEYAKKGFPVTEVIAGEWSESADNLHYFPGFSELFMPGGRPPAAGEIFKNPRLGETYSILANDGRDAFYSGDIARRIHDYMHANGGYLSYEDFASHQSDWVNPVSTNYRGHEVWELPPNGQGIAVLQMLNILEAYDLKKMGFGSPQYLHLLIEAKKLAFEDRARYYADPEFNEIPVDKLISKQYAASRRTLINTERASHTLSYGDPEMLAHGDTVYLTAADSAGNMVSLIQSNYRGMGSGMTIAGLGFGLQNRGELFSLETGHPNVYAPGKRPFHTIIPAFVTRDDGSLLTFGVMGADMQPQGQVQILVNLIDFGMNLQEAGDAPRIRHNGSSSPTGDIMSDGGTVLFESGFKPDVFDTLEGCGHRKGHNEDSGSAFGGYQAILWEKNQGVYLGASESRKDGHAAGY
ncbi:uncharacterized protein METZ01_LOCUS62187 [marine metagenome]|uniref:Gamma-glutamyltransferase n=1 Tax=marine metagenome TaxID=408172 RepID=A0A381T6H7_9ZZZZ